MTSTLLTKLHPASQVVFKAKSQDGIAEAVSNPVFTDTVP